MARMGLINLILDAVILAANVGLALLPLLVAATAFRHQVLRAAVWNDERPMLGPTIGLVHAGVVLVIWFFIYWGSYRLTGFPMWMRWILG